MNELYIKNGTFLPINEITITTSRAGGPGGQHVNKTNTKVTLRWSLKNSNVFNENQKIYLNERLKNILTIDGDLIVHNNATRSQLQNKEFALNSLAQILRKALHVPKKRIASKMPKKIKENILQKKKERGDLKKLRSKINKEY